MILPDNYNFWERVDIRSQDECWLWKLDLYHDDYGKVKIKGKTYSAHRVAYEIKNGTIQSGLQVLHTCDTPACCNPKHLFLGTKSDNMQDMIAKGRRKFGVSRPNKITSSDKKKILDLAQQGIPKRKISKMFGISPRSVRTIING